MGQNKIGVFLEKLKMKFKMNLARLRHVIRLRLTDFAVRYKRYASIEDDSALRSVNARMAAWHMRVLYFLKRSCYLVYRNLVAVVKLASPVLLGLVGVGCAVFVICASAIYTVALQVVVDDTPLEAYVDNEQTFNRVREQLANAFFESNNEEYYIDSYPSLQMVVVNRDKLNTEEELFDAVFNTVSPDLNRSYLVSLDGVVLGTLKKESEVLALRQALVSAYVDNVDSGTWTIVNSFTYQKGQYSNLLTKTYDDILALFTKPVKSVRYVVQSGDTANSIAKMFGLSVPVLMLLNEDVDTDQLQKNTVLEVGAPAYSLTVRETKVVVYGEIIPYQTVTVTSDKLFQGQNKVTVTGKNGYNEITVNIVSVNGTEMSRTEVSRTVVRDAITQHVTLGTKTIAPSGEFKWPLASYSKITSYYGMRELNGKWGMHKGLDIAAAYGTKIYAVDDGVIYESGWQEGGLGYYVKIDHGNGVISVYGHCSRLVKSMKKGKAVSKGDVIAYVGSTGNSTGNHLHFALWLTDTKEYINPLPYLKAPNTK